MGQEEATATLAAARRAGMSPGDCVAGLVAGVPVLLNGGGRSDHIAALTTSNAHVANLSRNVDALARFLTQANVEQARVYRDMLGTLNGDVRRASTHQGQPSSQHQLLVCSDCCRCRAAVQQLDS
jgi:hypothetical protein